MQKSCRERVAAPDNEQTCFCAAAFVIAAPATHLSCARMAELVVAEPHGPADGLTADSMLKEATDQSVRKPTSSERVEPDCVSTLAARLANKRTSRLGRCD